LGLRHRATKKVPAGRGLRGSFFAKNIFINLLTITSRRYNVSRYSLRLAADSGPKYQTRFRKHSAIVKKGFSQKFRLVLQRLSSSLPLQNGDIHKKNTPL
jgi:hypothetical protein